MKRSAHFLMAASLLLCVQARAQRLIYSLSYVETPVSFRAHFPNGALGPCRNEQLATLRGSRKTEIYSVSMIDGKRTLLFSDEGMNFEIMPAPVSPGFPLFGSRLAYVTGVERECRTTPNPGVYAEPPGVYEISLDGSNRFRRLFERKPNQSAVFVNSAGSKAMLEALVNDKYTISIYEMPAWKLLRSWNLTKLTEAHCPGCLPVSYDWLADGDRLFFNLDTGADDSRELGPGSYIVAEDGTDLGTIPPETGQLRLPGYVRQKYVMPHLIGQLPDGSYLFRDYALKKGPLPKPPIELEPFLVISSSDSSSQKQTPLQRLGLRQFYLSRSGKYLAYVEDRQIPNYRTERHLWGRDLQSGEEKELFVAPPPNPPTSPEPNVTFSVLGWVNNN